LSEIKIGTSSYTYSWNKKKPTPFQWYVNQGFNSVEINASYYRFPTEAWLNTWLSIAPLDHFTFSIKESAPYNCGINLAIRSTGYTQL
jgi:uncharacterized protein YecE (DUF72 family)